ncbi:MAG TPA: hypothetical protein VMV04_09015 [Thermodesulfobacteriota bacterium]|nr:hypothetical protein [Thermodesulfobacteriota bacterium]
MNSSGVREAIAARLIAGYPSSGKRIPKALLRALEPVPAAMRNKLGRLPLPEDSSMIAATSSSVAAVVEMAYGVLEVKNTNINSRIQAWYIERILSSKDLQKPYTSPLP